MITKLLIEQHIHGAYGVDFNKATVEEVVDLTFKIRKEGVGAIFPTLVTDSIDNIKRQIRVIKDASEKQTSDCAKILGIHLEGIFINPQKRGIHNSKFILAPTIENFSIIANDFIKIVTLAPELCSNNLIKYLSDKGIKVQAGHCIGADLTNCSAVTHMYNAMEGINHRKPSTALSALIDDNIYAEIIADGVHVSDDALKLLFKTKPANRILLVSDALPCTHSNLKEFVFADETIYFDGVKATSKEGTLAGCTKLLPEIIQILAKKDMFKQEFINNIYEYHKINLNGSIEWDENYNIVKVN
jgi:N-acetylglucosamine-6-phosphate deacetylase